MAISFIMFGQRVGAFTCFRQLLILWRLRLRGVLTGSLGNRLLQVKISLISLSILVVKIYRMRKKSDMSS